MADTTIGLPYPYTNEFARLWISSHADEWEARRGLNWTVVKIGDDQIVGYAGLHNMDVGQRQAELRFWVGYAQQLARHPLAGRVLFGIGMAREGLVRKRVFKGGMEEEVICRGALRDSWNRLTTS